MRFLNCVFALVFLAACQQQNLAGRLVGNSVSTGSSAANPSSSGSSTPSAGGATNPPAVSGGGLGHSTMSCLDKDGDGYGVGPGCLGPDADDNDPAVFSGTQAITKYGSLKAFFAHLGYNPQHIFYLDAASGNDSTALIDDSAHPFQTWSQINSLMASGKFLSGDMVLFRAGTWHATTIAPISGAAGRPTILMSYPGEVAWIDNTSTGNTAVDLVGISYVVVDGIKITGGTSSGSGCLTAGTIDGSASFTSHDNVIRNIEAKGCGQGMIMANIRNVLIEDNLIRDTSAGGQHCVYLGSRSFVSQDNIIRRNICYNALWNGFHLNGRFNNLQVDQNLIYSTGIAGISFQDGTSNSFIRSNLIFNTASAGINISNYAGDCSLFGQGGTGLTGCPWDQTGNLFENNTIYQAGKDPTDGADSAAPAFLVNNYSVNEVGDLGHNTFRNNIFVGVGMGGHYPPVVYMNADKVYLATSVFQNNLFWSLDGAGDTAAIGFGAGSSFGFQGYTCAGAASITTMSGCLNSDPKFTSASPSFWNSPTSFDLHLQSNSTAVHEGTSVGAPSFDLTGKPFSNPPSIGAYEL